MGQRGCVSVVVGAALGLIVVGPPVTGAHHTIPYKVDRAGRASLGVYTKAGCLVRLLRQGKKLKPGSHAAQWDGLDLRGFPQLIARIIGLDEGLIGRCAPEEAEEIRRLPDGLAVRLPDNAALDSSKVERDLGVRIAPLAESLPRFQEEMQQVEAAQEG